MLLLFDSIVVCLMRDDKEMRQIVHESLESGCVKSRLTVSILCFL